MDAQPRTPLAHRLSVLLGIASVGGIVLTGPACTSRQAAKEARLASLLGAQVASAQEAHAGELEALKNHAQLIAEVDTLRLTLNLKMEPQLAALGVEHLGDRDVDVFAFTDKHGELFSSVLGGPKPGVDWSRSPLVARALSGEAVAATMPVDTASFFGQATEGDPPTTLVALAVSPIHFRDLVLGTVVLGVSLHDNARHLDILRGASDFDHAILVEENLIASTLGGDSPVSVAPGQNASELGANITRALKGDVAVLVARAELAGPDGSPVATLLVMAPH